MDSIPGLGRFPEVGNGNPLQDSRLENPMDRKAWLATVHELQSQTGLGTQLELWIRNSGVGVFCYGNSVMLIVFRMPLGPPRVGAGCQRNQPVVRGLELSILHPHLLWEKGAGG